jgi:hypothetical protein
MSLEELNIVFGILPAIPHESATKYAKDMFPIDLGRLDSILLFPDICRYFKYLQFDKEVKN